MIVLSDRRKPARNPSLDNVMIRFAQRDRDFLCAQTETDDRPQARHWSGWRSWMPLGTRPRKCQRPIVIVGSAGGAAGNEPRKRVAWRSSAPHDDRHDAAARRHDDHDRPGKVTSIVISSRTSSSTSGNTMFASRSAPPELPMAQRLLATPHRSAWL
ncbi:hypothetical protein ABIB82_007665 [Bradyrhizobium sp. i1.8.4]|uniref:hypothetical protein n=1 Tax=unclassified Bradyrhizobium TaxID=2631580 RepID=UPI003D1E6461